MRQSRCCIPLPVWGRSERLRYEMCAPSEPQTLHRPWLDSQEAYVVHVCAFQVLPISWRPSPTGVPVRCRSGFVPRLHNWLHNCTRMPSRHPSSCAVHRSVLVKLGDFSSSATASIIAQARGGHPEGEDDQLPIDNSSLSADQANYARE